VPKRRAWLVAVAALAVVVGVAAIAATRSEGHRGPVSITGPVRVVGADERTLLLVVPTCGGDPAITVTESATEVHLRIISTSSSGNKCADDVEAQLRDGLGARTVVDDATGEQLAIEHG
jgi:hypothetical protein